MLKWYSSKGMAVCVVDLRWVDFALCTPKKSERSFSGLDTNVTAPPWLFVSLFVAAKNEA